MTAADQPTPRVGESRLAAAIESAMDTERREGLSTRAAYINLRQDIREALAAYADAPHPAPVDGDAVERAARLVHEYVETGGQDHGLIVADRLLAAARAGKTVDREIRETDDEQGVRLLRGNRDYWRGLAESRTADLRDLRAAVRGSVGITGPASDDDLMTALVAARGDAALSVVEWGVRYSTKKAERIIRTDGQDEAGNVAAATGGEVIQREVSEWREVRDA